MLFINPAPLIFFLGGGEVHLLCLPYCFFFLRGDVCLYNFIRSCPFKPAGIEKRKTRVLLSTLSVVFTLGVWKGEEKKKKKDPFFLLIVLWPALLYFFQVPPPLFFTMRVVLHGTWIKARIRVCLVEPCILFGISFRGANQFLPWPPLFSIKHKKKNSSFVCESCCTSDCCHLCHI